MHWSLASALVAAAMPLMGCAAMDVPATSPLPVMSLERYGQVRHGTPYVLRLCKGAGSLRYVGVRHTRDPADPSVDAIVAEFNGGRPDLALVEGPLYESRPTLPASVEAFGEPGALLFLATRSAVFTRSLDLPLPEEMASVVARFGETAAVAFYGLRVIAQEQARNANFDASPFVEGKVVPWLKRNGLLTEKGADDFRSAAVMVAGMDPISHNIPLTWFDPQRREHPLFNDIVTYLVRRRDQRFVEVVVDEVQGGKSVLGVAGVSHVVMQESAIASRLGCPTTVRDRSHLDLGSLSRRACDAVCRVD